jgi:type I restriction enzyme R subunit
MSELLDSLVKRRREQALSYQEYLREIVELAKKVKNPAASGNYPKALNTPGRRALYDNLGRDEALALAVDAGVRRSLQDGWRTNTFKVRRVRNAINTALSGDAEGTERILELVKRNDEY